MELKDGFFFENHASKEEWLEARSKAGFGASDIATICGKNPYESPLEFWQRKIEGRVIAENDDMRRGHELEGVVRDTFMDKFGSSFELEYYEFGMYSCEKFTRQFATLDGMLIAKKDVVIGLSPSCRLEMKKGERCILEIKNPKPRSQAGYEKWKEMPEYYLYQAVAQMMATGVEKHLLVANLTGDFATSPFGDVRYFFNCYSNFGILVDNIANAVKKMDQAIKERIMPDSKLFNTASDVTVEEEKYLPVLKTEINVGNILNNFDAVKSDLQCFVAKYDGLTFSDKEIKEAKATRAELKKCEAQIDNVRKSVKKQWNAPLIVFENQCKELSSIVFSVESKIDGQVKAFEDKNKEEKRKNILSYINISLFHLEKDLSRAIEKAGGIPFNEKWLNATYKMSQIVSDVDTYIDRVKQDFENFKSIQKSLDKSIGEAMTAEYIRSGLNLSSALAMKDRIIEQREREKEESKKDTTDSEELNVAQPAASENVSRARVITKIVKFSHSNTTEFKNLIIYLKEHGFSCEEVK